MHKTALAIVAGVLLVVLPSHAQQATTKDQLLGTWKVVTLTATSGKRVSPSLGEQVAGYVSFTPDRVWVLFVDSTRQAPDTAALTDSEAAALMKSHVAWTGTYATAEQTPDGLKVIVHVDTSSNQAMTGSDRVYFIRVEGNKLRVKSPDVVVPKTSPTSGVEFDLVKAD
jgi:hypothetical protein